MKVLTVTTQKGGVGKTTLALLIAQGEALKGQRVLLIDLDQQGDATYSLVTDYDASRTSYEVLTGDLAIEDATAPVEGYLSLEVVPASQSLARVEVELSGQIDTQYILADKLADVEQRYDLVVIDTPPTLNVLVANALTSADGLVIPVQADSYSLKGLQSLVEMVQQIKRRSNPGLEIYGIVLNRYNARTNYSKAVHEGLASLAEGLGTKVYQTTLRDSVTVKEAQGMKEALYSYAPKAPVTQDASHLLAEIEEDLHNDQ